MLKVKIGYKLKSALLYNILMDLWSQFSQQENALNYAFWLSKKTVFLDLIFNIPGAVTHFKHSVCVSVVLLT